MWQNLSKLWPVHIRKKMLRHTVYIWILLDSIFFTMTMWYMYLHNLAITCWSPSHIYRCLMRCPSAVCSTFWLVVFLHRLSHSDCLLQSFQHICEQIKWNRICKTELCPLFATQFFDAASTSGYCLFRTKWLKIVVLIDKISVIKSIKTIEVFDLKLTVEEAYSHIKQRLV